MRDDDGNYYEDGSEITTGCLIAVVIGLLIWVLGYAFIWWVFNHGITVR